MDEIRFTPKAIKHARQAAKRLKVRLIKFPDGITRHITLPGWQWAVLDRFDREDVLLSSERIIAISFEAAQADKSHPEEPFEETLRYHLSISLTEGVAWSSGYLPRRTNDV